MRVRTSQPANRRLQPASSLSHVLVAVMLLLLVSPVSASSRSGSQGVTKNQIRTGKKFDVHGRVVYAPESGRVYYASDGADSEEKPTVKKVEGKHSEPIALAPAGAAVSLEWYESAYGTGIGFAGTAIADIDDDGALELVASASPGSFGDNTYWYVVRFDGVSYSKSWASFPFDETIFRLTVAQLDLDAPLEVLIALSGRLLIYDGQSLQKEAEYTTSVVEPRGLAVADVDNDSAVEAAVCDSAGTWVYDLDTGAEQLSLPGSACTDLAIGETDGTAGLEIVLANGENQGLVLDAVTGAVEWTHPLGFGDFLATGDLDGDALEEIVAGFSWSGLQVWHGDTHAYAWGVPVFNLATMTIGDVEGDGPVEVVYGDAQWGDVHVLDGTDGSEKWSVGNPEHGVTRIAIGDLEDDGTKEISFGAGFTSTGPDHLYIVDTVLHELKWESLDYSGPFYGLAHGDVDADGEPELVSTCYESDSGYGDGLYFVHDAITKELEYQSPQPTGSNWTGLWKIGVADADDDPELEVFLPTSYTYGGALQCRDGGDHHLQWETVLSSGMTFASLRIGDPDNDGSLEAVSGVEIQTTGATGVYVFVHDAETGALEWQSPDLQSFFGFWAHLGLLRVADIDDDDVGELLVAQRGDDLMALDPVAHTIDLATTGLSITALDTVDLDLDGMVDIVIGTEGGLLQTVDPVSGVTTSLGGPYPAAIDGLAVVELTGDGVLDFVFASADRVHLVDGETMLPIWVSEDVGDWVGRNDSLVVGDFDDDGHAEVWVNAGPIGHVMFQVLSLPDLVFTDGFESGDTSAWVATSS